MLSKPVNLLRVVGLVVVVAVLAAGCGGGGGIVGGEGSIAQDYDLSGAEFTVGSKEFTEQLILGNITLLALQEAGATVNDQIGLAGSDAARTALTSGEIDMYWEYLGTAWINYLGETGNIPEPQFETVSERDQEENSVHWLEPAPEQNSYAIAANRDIADEYGLRTLSDIGPFIQDNPDLATLCVGGEFADRDDGLPGVQETYGWEFPEDQVNRIQDGLVYDQVSEGDQCNFGSVFTTDGRIPNLNLTVLEDDQDHFPAYNGALTIRQDVFEENEQLADLFAPISELLTTEQMQQLNSQVDVDGLPPEEVAETFLRDNGFIS
jgi:osmoprotectant transport system substrate-binding protein